MSYVDAAYAICLSVLFLYGASVVARRRRLERAERLGAPGSLGGSSAPAPSTSVPSAPASSVPASSAPAAPPPVPRAGGVTADAVPSEVPSAPPRPAGNEPTAR